MGAYIEINDTLRITKEQGFPEELNIDTHLKTPFEFKDFENKIFDFKDKPAIRVYKTPPIRNFLVEDIGGKWLYWGLCHIVEIRHDYINQTTSGKYKIIKIYTPEEMKKAFDLVHNTDENQNYFK